MTELRSLLVRAPNWLGDCVMCLPALEELHAGLPGTRLTVACREALGACFAAHPAVAEVMACPPAGRVFGPLQSGWALRGRGFEAGLLFTNSFSSALWLWCSGTRRRIGYARDGRSLFLTEGVRVTPALSAAHMSDYYGQLAARLGADPGPGVPPPGAREETVIPHLTVPAHGREQAAALRARLADVPAEAGYAVLAPVSAYGAVKDWPAARYAEAAGRLARDRGLAVFVSGTAAQADACCAIAAQAGEGVRSVAGEVELAGFLGLLEGCTLFLGGDSGGAHVAAALGRPTVVIFGITEPSRTRPLGMRVRLVGAGGVHTPDLNDPAVQAQAREALSGIGVDDVLAEIAHVLS